MFVAKQSDIRPQQGITFMSYATARYSGPMPEDLIPHIARHAKEAELEVQQSEHTLIVTLPSARVALDRDASDFHVRIEAVDAVALHHIREYLLYVLDHVAPGLATKAVWEGDIPRSSRPPSFASATVRRIWRVAPNFLRVELACDDTARLEAGSGMHFSLLLPPAGRVPVWPELDESGRTIWPKGADSLHRAVYTFVDLDPEAGRFTFDIFEHEGGRTTEWARAAQPGEIVGLSGPGSGDFPPGTDMLIAGDETALPAIRRILACSDPARRGRVFIEVGCDRDVCDLPRPAGMALTWVRRNTGETLWDHLSEIARPESPDPFVWIAAEKDLVRKAKERFRGKLGIGADQGYFAYYWSA